MIAARELGIPDAIMKKPPPPGYGQGRAMRGRSALSTPEIDAALIALENQDWMPENAE